jgi:hypothetical protein
VASVKNRLAATCSETAANLSGHLEHDLAFIRRRRVARHSLAWTIEQLRTLGTTEIAAPSAVETVVERVRADAADRSS